MATTMVLLRGDVCVTPRNCSNNTKRQNQNQMEKRKEKEGLFVAIVSFVGLYTSTGPTVVPTRMVHLCEGDFDSPLSLSLYSCLLLHSATDSLLFFGGSFFFKGRRSLTKRRYVRTCEEDLGLIEASRDWKPVIAIGGLEDRISWRILLQFFFLL